MDTWRVDSFVICRGLSSDTPVEYHQLDDLRYGPSTAALLPKQMRPGRLSLAGKADETEGAKATGVSREESIANIAQILAENARHIADGVKALEKEGAAAVDDAVVKSPSWRSKRRGHPRLFRPSSLGAALSRCLRNGG